MNTKRTQPPHHDTSPQPQFVLANGVTLHPRADLFKQVANRVFQIAKQELYPGASHDQN